MLWVEANQHFKLGFLNLINGCERYVHFQDVAPKIHSSQSWMKLELTFEPSCCRCCLWALFFQGANTSSSTKKWLAISKATWYNSTLSIFQEGHCASFGVYLFSISSIGSPSWTSNRMNWAPINAYFLLTFVILSPTTYDTS